MCHDSPEIESLIRHATAGRLALETVDACCRTSGVGFADLCNAVALAVARRFDDGSTTYAEADAAMNALYGVMIRDAARQGDGFQLAEPAFAIYLAFDAGEYSRGGGEDPVERYTRLLIKKVLGDA